MSKQAQQNHLQQGPLPRSALPAGVVLLVPGAVQSSGFITGKPKDIQLAQIAKKITLTHMSRNFVCVRFVRIYMSHFFECMY